MLDETRKSYLTKNVLKCISTHLSSREDCKNIEYTIIIRHDIKSNYDEIIVSPYITVFPSIHDRKESDRRSVAYHVIYYHFSELFENAEQSTVHICKDSLIHGEYKYKKYVLTNRRRWVRIS